MAITKVSNSVLKDLSVHNSKIADNAVDAAKLNVSGNGISGQALLSDGDGTFSWGQAGETYTAGTGITLTGNEFSIGQSVGTNNDVQFASIASSGPVILNSQNGIQAIYSDGGVLASYDPISTDFSFGGILNASQATTTLEMAVGGPAFMSYDGSIQEINFDGTLTATGDVIAYYSSDERLKDNIKPIENALDKIESIGGYTYEWNDKQQTYTGADIGVIAQEIEAIAPELVIDRETGFKAVKYEKLVAILIEGIKELSAKVNELENKL
jgi:hypothetical protein